jgi:hypothetical protein
VCANNHRARLDTFNAAFIEAIERRALKPETIAYTLEKAAEVAERELKKNPDMPKQLEAEARKLCKELERFLQLIGEGKAPDAVMVEIRRREERSKVIERQRAALVEAPPTWSVAQIQVMCGERLRRFPELLHGVVPVANQAIGKLLAEPFTFYPVTTSDGTRTLGFNAITTLGPLFDPAHKGLASPRGLSAFIHRLRVPISGVALVR